MDVLATHKNARMSPQKLRPLCRIIVGLPVAAAQQQLQYLPGKAPGLISAVLQSAVANATHNHDLQADNLVVRKIQVGAGLVMKRFMPVSRGMAHGIWKRTSHITITVGEMTPSTPKKSSKAKKATIEEMTAEEYAERQLTERLEDQKVAEEKESDIKPQAPMTVEKRQDKTQEAFQRTKMMQQGGDQKKTHRRKSLSSGS